MAHFLDNKIEFVKGIGPQRAALLNKELSIFTYKDLLSYYPFRHEDRTKIYLIKDILEEMPVVQVKGKILFKSIAGDGSKKRLVAFFKDQSGEMDLLWFQGIDWVDKSLKNGIDYLVYGKPVFFNGKFSITHPEIEIYNPAGNQTGFLQPVYNMTEKLKKKFIYSKTIAKFVETLLEAALPHLEENLSEELIRQYQFFSKREAIQNIHFPKSIQELERAKNRLKFEELFFIQLKLLKLKLVKKHTYKGQVFKDSHLLKDFYTDHLPFELTNAQKRVVKEIFTDLNSGKQMNRLIQGDVGSGKTMVAFLSMLIVLSNGAQACMMAPTELLAEQHFRSLQKYAELLGITIDKLTGSTKARDRRIMHERLMNGNLKILVGTHALIEDAVQFENLGLCIIDEQHRFGVEQRSRLWKKNDTSDTFPHILVMTATPIPRTLAMTLYGDLDVSVIDEMPKGRKPIITAHRYDSDRLRVFGFLKEEISKGRQIYIVYPLIEESEKMDYKNLMDGYESISRAFPENHLSIVHGRMSSADKDFEMQRFIKKETQLMVATTVIEVGVDVPNASVMVIENAERFGLAQLHQLRGRVGRGAEQSYCILMSDYKMSKESKLRIDTMVSTNNGFEIADVDLQLRGPGNLMGKEQSGLMDLIIADLSKDGKILQEARNMAMKILDEDPYLEKKENENIKKYLLIHKKETFWSRIS